MIKKLSFIFLLIIVAVATYFALVSQQKRIRVGILHSLSGTMSISEKGVAEATLAAIEEINSHGGVMGVKLEPVSADGMSKPQLFGIKARQLIEEDGVSAIFGCWTSASRKEVKGVVEKTNNLLFYPVQYEGLEESSSIVYLGQLPNQQLKPAMLYALRNFGKEFFLVGSDYIFPRAANIYISDTASSIGAKIVAERYVKLGSKDFASIVAEIKAKKPKAILNTLNGDSNIAFFKELYKAGITAKEIPVFSFSVAKDEVAQIASVASKKAVVGHYAAWSYFDVIASKENEKFKALLKKRGIEKPTDAMEAAYVGVWLYKQAVEECGSFDPAKVKKALPIQSYNGPGGITTITDGNMNAWKSSRIGRINDELDFEIVEESAKPIKPDNYPENRLKEEWNKKLNELYLGWNNNWAAEK